MPGGMMARNCPICEAPLKYAKNSRGWKCENEDCTVHHVKFYPGTFDVIKIELSSVSITVNSDA